MYIWQERVSRELNIILPEIKYNNRNVNILFRAPSGYGKTTAGFICLNFLGLENSKYYIPSETENFILDQNKRFHFIDEVHLLKEPEFLYPFLDGGNYTFILATNESGTIKEPLRNRCIPIIFSKYSDIELREIVKQNLSSYPVSDSSAEIISGRVKGNPRIAKIICMRMDFFFSRFGYSDEREYIENILNNILNIKENGLTELDEIYLNFLRSCGGTSSLSAIINSTHIDKETILSEIEPNLLSLGLLRISNRGRKLNEQ